MFDQELKKQIVSDKAERLQALIELLEGLDIIDPKLDMIRLIAYQKDGSQQTIQFGGEELDTYLLFNELARMARTRLGYLEQKLQELSQYD